MIRSKGEAGTGDIVEAVRHLRSDQRRDPPPDGLLEEELRERRQGARRAARARALGRERGAPAGRDVLRRRDRDAGRRFAGDAARRRGRVRRLRHLQVRGPGGAGRAIVDATTNFADPERVAAASRDSAARWRASRRRKLPERAAAVTARLVGALTRRGRRARPPGRLRGARQDAGDARRGGARGARRGRPRRARRAVLPGGESTTMTLGSSARTSRDRCATACAAVPVLGTCAGMIMLDRDHLGVLDMRCERNAFGRQVRSSRPTSRSTGFARAVPRGLHPRALGRGARRTVSACSAASTGTRSPSPPAGSSRCGVPSGADRRRSAAPPAARAGVILPRC